MHMYGVGMLDSVPHSPRPAWTDVAQLTGLPFHDSDEVIRAAIAEASVPALLMSMVHMTGDKGLLKELPGPFALIVMDIQGGMSEADKAIVRERAFDVVRAYRDRGCPPPFLPDGRQLQDMLDVMTAGQVTAEFVDYIAADLRLSDADQNGPVLRSTPEQRSSFPVVVIGCGEAGLLAGIKLKQAGVPFTIIEKQSGVGGTWLANRYPGCRVDIPNHYYAYSFEPTDHWSHFYSEQPEILQYLNDVMERHDIAPYARFSTEVIGCHLGRRIVGLASGDPRSRRWPGDTDCPGRDLRCWPVQQRGYPGHQGRQRLRRAGISHRGLGGHGRPDRQAGGRDRCGRQWVPAGTGHRADHGAGRRVPAHRAVDGSEHQLPHSHRRRSQVGGASPALLRTVAAVRALVAARRRRSRPGDHRPRLGHRRPVGECGQPRGAGSVHCVDARLHH